MNSGQPACSTCGDALVPGPLGLQCPRCLFSLAAVEGDDIGQVAALFPELQIEEKIARGGFGTVFRGEHRRMRRPVALKFLDTLLARSPEAVALFEREMIHAGALDHPGIVRAYDAGEREGHWFLIMELLDGEDCGALARRHRALPLAESCEIIRQAAAALHHAHGQGLVHRDVKPGNLMLARGCAPAAGGAAEPCVKVLDFGLAGLAVAPLFTEGDDRFLGTLEYMAPEQIEAPNRVDARADIYSLGATLRRLLTGVPLREGGSSEHSLFQRMKAITTEPAVPLVKLRPDLPADFRRLADCLVAIDPAARPASAEELAHRLAPWCAGADLARLFGEGPLGEQPFPAVRSKRSRRPPRLWAQAALLLLFFVALVGTAWRFRDRPRHGRLLPAVPIAPVPAGEGRPVFSPALIRARALLPEFAPRLLAADWEPAAELSSANAFYSVSFLPDGRLGYLHGWGLGSELLAVRPGEEARPLLPPFREDPPRFFALSHEGFIAWPRPSDPESRHIGRAGPDGTLLPVVAYDLTGESKALLDRAARAVALRDRGPQGYPYGFAAVLPGQVPEGSGVAAGDLLIADEGHRPIIPSVEVPPGLWRARFDSGAPATRLGALPGERHFPIAVAVDGDGVFFLSRSEPVPTAPVNSDDLDRRLYRWDRAGFHPCTLSEPLYDPVALAADPLTGDLYAAQGGLIPSATLALQRLLRLRPVPGEKDRYTVEVIAERFGKMTVSGIAFSHDGQRLAVCDGGNRVIVVLKRRASGARR